MKRVSFGRHAALLLVALMMALTTIGATAAYSKPDKPGKPGGTVDVQILGINDFHGNLEPQGTPVNGRTVGGAAYLDAYLDQRESENPKNTIRAHMGDLVGASPLISSYFHDEPSVYAMNEMGFDIGTIGNHEFDEGGEEMFRLIEGGQRTDGKQFKTGADGEQVNTSDPDYSGADFPYVISNVVYKDSGENVLPPYKVIKKSGMKVGFIGVSTLETPSIVVPDAVAPFEFLDMSDSVNKYTKELRKQGVETIVVMAHSGAVQSGSTVSGEIVPEIEEMSDAVDVVLAGHTHTPLDLEIDGKLVAQSRAFGAEFEDVDLTISRKTKDVVAADAELVTTYNDAVTPSADIAELVAGYKEQINPVANRVVGNAPETLVRPNRSDPTVDGESNLGNLIADAQRQQAGADIAFMNPGGIRADIQAGEVTFGELFTVQPFDNGLSSGELTGDEIFAILEQQFPPTQASGSRKVLQVSGIEVVYNESLAPGNRIVSVTLENGQPLDRSATYTVAANSFLITGGDGFTVFKEAQNVQSFGSDVEALEQYIDEELGGTIAVQGDNDRITKQG